MIRVPAPPGGKSLWVGMTEVTWDEYDVFSFDIEYEEIEKGQILEEDAIARPSKPYGERYRGFGKEGMPLLGIHYEAAKVYCRWLSEKTGHKYRLPTEEEWMWFATAGGKEKAENLDEIAWHAGNSEDRPHKVGQKKSNAWGLHDVLGNVAELIQSKDQATVCGGSFVDPPADVHFAARKQYNPKWQETDAQFPKSVWWYTEYASFVGLRVVREE